MRFRIPSPFPLNPIRPKIPRIFANATRAQKFKRWASLLPSFAPIRVIRGHPVFPVTLFQFSFSVPLSLQFSVYFAGSVGSSLNLSSLLFRVFRGFRGPKILSQF